jgi:hypothetical protein|tara:strand:+ start:72 stop:482 length:411 start_codon:yes stop_codon:yes gene_type:complete
MEEDFLATMKLVTGEEIISKVSYMPDEDSLVLENPMEVTFVDQQRRNAKVQGFSLSEWIHSTFDHMFVLPKQHVITMTEVEDKRIEKFYNESVQKHISQLTTFKESFEPQKFSRKMGNLGSIKETKKSLEDLFNRS